MNYDPSEKFREDPGEFELNDNFAAQLEMERKAAEQQAAAEAQAALGNQAPTGGQPEQPQQPQQQDATSTGEAFDAAKDYSYYEAQGMSRAEWNRLQMNGGISSSVENFATNPRDSAEIAGAVPAGIVDFGIDLINVIPGVNLPKITKFENDIAQSVRQISSVVVPTMVGAGALRAAGTAANVKVGAALGKSKFVQFLGERGVEALAGLGVGAVSSEYEEDNLTGTLKKNFPKTFDFIPDDMATLEGDSPDLKRQKNIKEDVGLGVVIDLASGAAKLVGAVAGANKALKRSTQLVGETDEAKKWLKENGPTKGETVEEAIIESSTRREGALDELGDYNTYLNPAMDTPMKGVHDMFDYGESGIRVVDDFGIVGSAVDAARISKNYDTVYGRIGNPISEPALKYALSDPKAAQDVVLELADQLKQAKDISVEGATGWKLSSKEILDANEDVAIQLFDPRMSKEDVRKVLDPYITRADDGTERLSEEGFGVAAGALRSFGKQVSGMDVARAQSLLAGSFSGRISDIAEGARLMTGTSAVREAQDKIIDLMQYTTQLSASAKYYKNRKMGLIRQIQNGFKNIEGYNEASVIGAGEVANRVFQDSQRFAATMRQIAENQPQLMDDILFAYELTDGKVDTIVKMNNYISSMTTDLSKALVNPNPEVQNKLVQGLWSNVFNSVLSAFSTPIAAIAGNFGGLMSQPVSHFAGAIAHGDFKAIQRGWIAYGSINDTLNKALPYAGSLFMKASKDPDSVKAATRLDLMLQSEKEMGFLKQAAATKAAEGNEGLQYLVSQIELMNDFAKDPILRFSSNAMTATDGFTGAFNASAEARFRAMDELREAGKPITKENVKPIADKYYNKMFDSNGIISDEAVKYTTSEMALNLDSPIGQSIGDMVEKVPAIRPFLMFQTTGLNTVEMAGKYAPFAPFQKDIQELAYKPLSELLANEEYVDQLLRARNINPDTMDSMAKQAKIADLKYTTLGRKFIGTATVAAGVGLLMNDRLTGDGLYDKEAQRSREQNSNWKPRSIKGLDGKFYSYEKLGPLADLLALIANVGDNFDMLGEAATENMLKKLVFTVGASVTDRIGLSTIRPLIESAAGDTSALARWGAGFTNSLGPLSGQRAEWGRVFSKGLQVVDNDFMSMLRNRNRFVDELDPTNRAPYIYSPVTGKTTNDFNFLQRLWNATGVMKVGAKQTDEEKFLEKIEFDMNTTFRTKDGVKLLPKERSELFRLMGEQGYFRAAIKDIMKDAGDWNTISRLRQERLNGMRSDQVSLDKWDEIHVRLSEARRQAEEIAYAGMDANMYAAIELRQMERNLSLEANRQGKTLEDNNPLEEPLSIRY